MKSRLIGIDCDEVLRPFYKSLIREYKKVYPDHQIKPLESWRVYSVESHFPIGSEIYRFFKEERPYQIFMDIEPFEGAREFVAEIASKNRVAIVTKQPSRLLEDITIQWLRFHRFAHHEVRLYQDKSEFEGDILLDDHTENLEVVERRGRTLPVAFNTNMNQDWRGLRVHSYKEFLENYEKFPNLIK